MAKNIVIEEKQSDGSLLDLYPRTSADNIVETTEKKIMTATEREQIAELYAVKDSSGKVNDIQTSDGTSILGSDKIARLPDYILSSQKGSNNGVASLGEDGKVLSSQLPSYVDDVLEYASISNFPSTGESGKIYVALDTNITYRWGGSSYVQISQSLAIGETSGTAYDGAKGKQNATDIASLKERVGTVEGTSGQNKTDIANIKNGTTKISKSESADKLSSQKTVTVNGDVSGSVTTDFSSNPTLTLSLPEITTEGTYSAVQVNKKGQVTSGGQVIEVGAAGQTTPSASLVVGGLFFKET